MDKELIRFYVKDIIGESSISLAQAHSTFKATGATENLDVELCIIEQKIKLIRAELRK